MPEDERQRVLDLVHRYGWNATSFQTLEAGYSYHFEGDDACVAYFDTGSAWVAAGAPIAPAEALPRVTAAFIAEARRRGRRCCFFATEERLLASTGDLLASLLIGHQPVWDPREWVEVLRQRRSLREQLRRARAKGVRVCELPGAAIDASRRAEMMALVQRWLSTRGMAPMDFLVRVEPFTFPAHRRYFMAERDGELVGFAALVPVPARAGWFLEDLVRDPRAPNGTAELLVDAVMRASADLGCDWLTLGLAPLAGGVDKALRFARASTRLLYDFEGLAAFKAKLRPARWSPIFLSYPPSQGAVVSLFDSIVAFTRGGLVTFALRSLLRGPTAVLRALAVLLVPWTLVLALAPAHRWFGSEWVKWGWVVFDIAVAGALFVAAPRRSLRLLTVLAIAVAADLVLTVTQALLFNLPEASSWFDYPIVAVAIAAPALALVVLWGARNQRLKLAR